MIDTQAIRNKILDLAMRGQLTEQLPGDGTAEELYQQIQAEMQTLIRAGTIKKEKKPTVVKKEDIPYDIPDNWKWVRLRGICTKIVDGDHNPPKGVSYKTDYLMLSAKNINHNRLESLDQVRYLSSDVFKIVNGRTKVEPGDIFFTIVATLGRSCVYDGGYNICFQRSVAVLTTLIFNRYLKYYLDSSYIQRFMASNSTGSAQVGFYLNQVEQLLIAIPPLAEQQRIVEKIEQAFSILDTIDTLQTQYADNLTALKAKLIDAAIQGKLTEQLPDDGTAEELYKKIQAEKQALIKTGKIKKEKPLPEIRVEEIPFEIPDNWKWVRLLKISEKITDGTHHSPVNTDFGKFMYVTAKNIKENGVDLSNITFVSEDIHKEIYSRCNPEKDDVLLIKDGATTGIVTVNNLEEPFSMLSSVALIKLLSNVVPWYVVYAMRSPWFAKYIRGEMTGVGITRVVLKQIETFLIPLPPLTEQQRIVKKLKTLHSTITY